MKLIDSNIIIYSAKEEYSFLRNLFFEENIYTSSICKLEVLGYHKLNDIDKNYFYAVFNILEIVQITNTIIERAIEIRQNFNIHTADAIIAATAITNDMTIITNNISDFANIKNIKILNPLQL